VDDSQPYDDNNPDPNNESATDEEILLVAKARFKIAAEAESENRQKEVEDLKFLAGDQWSVDIKEQRVIDKRPCLTINMLPQFEHQIVNDQLQNPSSVQVNPVDSAASVETAKVYEGLVRHIEQNSCADLAYGNALRGCVRTGLGYWRILTEYADPMAFQQEIKIATIKDRMSVYLDPFHKEIDGSDANWGFIFDNLSEDEYMAEFPGSKLSLMADWTSLGQGEGNWVHTGGCVVAEYYYKIFVKETICLLVGEGIPGGKASYLKRKLPSKLPSGMRITSERETLIPKIKWVKMNGIEILDRTDIPGQWIPIIPVVGDEIIIEGKKVRSGLIRNAKDPQKMRNFWASAQTEMITLAPRVPYIAAEGAIEGHEGEWQTANSKNHAVLEYNHKGDDGSDIPPPQRQNVDIPIQAFAQSIQMSDSDLKQTTGIYDPTVGRGTSDQSGKAIQRLNNQSQTSNFHYSYNLAKSKRHSGRIIVNWIPEIYDTQQVVRIIGADGEVSMIQINQIFDKGTTEESHFLDIGRYDCVVGTGPSYETKRQEAVAAMQDLVRSYPQLMNVIGDLVVRDMDTEGAQEMADRIKKSLPPNLTADDKNQTPIPPQVQQQLSQYSQMTQAMSQEIHKLSQIIETKQTENASKERIEALRAQNDLVLELLKHNAKDGQLAFLEETKLLHKRLDLLGVNDPVQNPGAGGPMPAAPPPNMPTGGPSPGPSMGGSP
jgi:hypothetical protein